jgi:hypothetical protein
LLLAGDGEGTLEIRFRFRGIRRGRFKRDIAGDAIGFGLEPSLFGCFENVHRFVNAAPSIIEMAKFDMGRRQI